MRSDLPPFQIPDFSKYREVPPEDWDDTPPPPYELMEAEAEQIIELAGKLIVRECRLRGKPMSMEIWWGVVNGLRGKCVGTPGDGEEV